ncbi:hypothetical protein RJ639_047074 [Escallonia herrerae]|uniref:Berberine/berberine-like domain-containing protein n=1 Tax=Escallonia herrerae TaxID=1293975 RepID=A0AA89B466_9ASTE|nr:hypothetical protein RJ639_047074 [Escallonia herrerae]
MATSETIPKSGPVHPSGGIVYATPYVAPAHGSVRLGERPRKFNGKDFKRWQQKMLFYLTTLNFARFLQEDAPDLGENPDRQTVAAVDAWKHSDFLCKNYILNGLDNALYNVYSPMVNAKALWESLERKYKTEDAGSKKFVVGKFLNFKMVDSKTVISQVQEFQLILNDIHAEGMVLGESFQVAALIEKLPPTLKDFKNYLKHKRKEMKLEDLIVRLRIEEDNRQSEKKAGSPWGKICFGRLKEPEGELGVIVAFKIKQVAVPEKATVFKEKFPELGLVREDCSEMSWIQSVVELADIYLAGAPPGVLLNKTTGEMHWTPCGGRMAETPESETPYPHRAGNIFMIYEAVYWNKKDGAVSQRHIDCVRKLYKYMTPFVAKNPRSSYLNYRDYDLGINSKGKTSYEEASVWSVKYFKDNFKRLAEVKAMVDPDDFFRSEQTIPPLSGECSTLLGI